MYLLPLVESLGKGGVTHLIPKIMVSPNSRHLTVFLLLFCFFQTTVNGQVLINEYSASNLESTPDNYSKYEDWIELHNSGSSSVNIGGYYLSDRISSTTKWKIPSGVSISAGGYLVFWVSGRDEFTGGQHHTSFKFTQIKKNPEYVVFSDQFGAIIDSTQLSVTQLAHSNGRTTNGASSWSVFTQPTPGNSNNSSTPYERYTENPVMSEAAGFYSASITLTISSNETNAQIHYTTDGSEPTSSSLVYSSPLAISSTTVVKARSISSDPDILPGLINFNTYFINASHQLVVVSVATDSIEYLINGDKSIIPIGSFEYFNENGLRSSIAYGEFNSHGQDSWVHDQRSIDFITRDEMGYSKVIKEKLFALSDRKKFQRIIIRAAGDDNYPGIDSSAHLRDMFVQTIAQKGNLNLDVRTAARCVMYVNGEYWGIYSLREKVDDPDYMKYYYDQSRRYIEFIMTWGWTWVEFGDSTSLMQTWYDLYDYIVDNDMSNPANYDYVTSQYDVTSLTDYILVNSYVVCSDWLNYNVGWWRGRNPIGGHKKWGYILWDEDATFGHYYNYTGIPEQTPYVDPCYPEQLDNWWSDPEGHITILKNLRDNPDFDQYYVSRYIDLMNTTFSCDSMLALLDSLADLIDPEMQTHINKWGGTYTKWKSNVQLLRDFIIERCDVIPDGLNNCYNLTGPYDLELAVEPAGSGKIGLNSLTLDQFPWNGSYYGGVEIKLSGIESDQNFVFDHWVVKTHTSTPGDSVKDITLDITSEDSIVAVFKQVSNIGVPDKSNNTAITFHPNPFNSSTILTISQELKNGELILYDLLGKQVRKIEFNNTTQYRVNRASLPAGIYLYKVLSENGSLKETGKLVAQ